MLATRHTSDHDLVEAARDGDDAAFGLLVEAHRDTLRSRCRRIVGSPHDAEDALQETLVRAWRGLPGFADGRAVAPWLNRIATNASLDVLAKRRRLPPVDDDIALDSVGAGAPSPAARYEQREELEQALVAVMRHLPARQRAALILSDALGLSAREAADALDTTTASVYSALQRARKLLDETAVDEEPSLVLEDPVLRADVQRLTAAMERADVGEIVTTLVSA